MQGTRSVAKLPAPPSLMPSERLQVRELRSARRAVQDGRSGSQRWTHGSTQATWNHWRTSLRRISPLSDRSKMRQTTIPRWKTTCSSFLRTHTTRRLLTDKRPCTFSERSSPRMELSKVSSLPCDPPLSSSGLLWLVFSVRTTFQERCNSMSARVSWHVPWVPPTTALSSFTMCSSFRSSSKPKKLLRH